MKELATLKHYITRRFARMGAGIGIATLGALTLAAPSFAQVAGVPTREEIQRDRLEERLRTQGDAVAVESEVERAPCPLANPQFADIRFTLSRAQFDGLGQIDPSMLDGTWSGLVGQELPVAAVCDIRDRAATALRRAGYLAAVQVPAQTIEDGVVRFDVVLARLGSVQVRGDAGPSEAALQKYINKLVGQPVFNIEEAERYLLLARDIPGLDVRLTLRPAPREEGAPAGVVVGVFDVVRTPIYVDVNAQNYGSESVGRYGLLGRVRFNGLTGLGDETVLSAYATSDFDEQFVLQGNHEFRLGSEGLTVGAGMTYAWTQPDVPGPNVFESDTLVGNIYARYPFIRSQTSNLYGTVGFDLIDQKIDFTGLPLSEDKLRVINARLDFSTIDEDSVLGRGGYSAFEPKLATFATLEVRQGLSGLGASESCGVGFVNCTQPGVVPPSRLDADPSAFVIRFEGQVDYRPNPLLKFSLKPRAQYTSDPLLSYEQFSGGNYTVGRGYDPGAVIGDSGFGGHVEVAYGSLIPETPDGFAFQYYAFADHISTWTRNVGGDPQSLTSVGAGVRATIGRQGTLDAFVAVPLERAPFATRKGDPRFLFTYTVQIAPWRN